MGNVATTDVTKESAGGGGGGAGGGGKGTPSFVAIESPYHNTDPALLRRNVCYAIQCLKHAGAEHNELGYMPHLNYTQLAKNGEHMYVSDDVEDEYSVGRERVIEFTTFVRTTKAERIVLYTDFGISRGMQYAVEAGEKAGVPIIKRTLPEHYMKEVLPAAATAAAASGEKPAAKRRRADA